MRGRDARLGVDAAPQPGLVDEDDVARGPERAGLVGHVAPVGAALRRREFREPRGRAEAVRVERPAAPRVRDARQRARVPEVDLKTALRKERRGRPDAPPPGARGTPSRRSRNAACAASGRGTS